MTCLTKHHSNLGDPGSRSLPLLSSPSSKDLIPSCHSKRILSSRKTYPLEARILAYIDYSSYIGLPVFGILWLGYKYLYKTKVIKPQNVDLVTGLQAINEEEAAYLEEEKLRGPMSRRRKFFESL